MKLGVDMDDTVAFSNRKLIETALLFDEKDIVNRSYQIIGNRIYELEPIIEADTESEKV